MPSAAKSNVLSIKSSNYLGSRILSINCKVKRYLQRTHRGTHVINAVNEVNHTNEIMSGFVKLY